MVSSALDIILWPWYWLVVAIVSYHWYSLILSRRIFSFSDAHAFANSISSPLVTV